MGQGCSVVRCLLPHEAGCGNVCHPSVPWWSAKQGQENSRKLKCRSLVTHSSKQGMARSSNWCCPLTLAAMATHICTCAYTSLLKSCLKRCSCVFPGVLLKVESNQARGLTENTFTDGWPKPTPGWDLVLCFLFSFSLELCLWVHWVG